jgi:LAO/AO transport system kinase
MLLSLDSNRRQASWRIPIVKTSALKEQGLVELVDAIQAHRTYLAESQLLAERTKRQSRSELSVLIQQAVAKALQAKVSEEEWQTFSQQIAERTRDPYSIAQELEARLGLL